MSAADDLSHAAWPDEQFWAQFNGLETRHQRVQSEHESVRRSLETLRHERVPDLHEVWGRYCEVIAELDRSTAELELFRSRGAR
jgi:hypothetical protein